MMKFPPLQRACDKAIQGFARKILDCFAALAMTMLLFTPAHAEPSTYSPGICDFQVTFPDAPYTVRRCEDEAGKRCYDLVSYTQTYALDSTVNFRVICNPIGPGVREKYNEEVSKAAVRAMGRKNALETFETNFRKEAAFNHASLVGEGLSGRTPMIYLAQLWVGENSVMSVEAELIGEALEEPDKLFTEVMRSISLKKAEEPEENAKPEETDKAEKPAP